MPTQINYIALIKSAKRAARDVLRTEKVEALLGYISSQEANIKNSEKRIEEINLDLERSEYELRIATQFASPDLEAITKRVENAREQAAKAVETCNESIAACKEKIAEYNTKIENWHNGTSKVDADRQASMALSFVQDKLGASFVRGEYDAAVSEVTS